MSHSRMTSRTVAASSTTVGSSNEAENNEGKRDMWFNWLEGMWKLRSFIIIYSLSKPDAYYCLNSLQSLGHAYVLKGLVSTRPLHVTTGL